MSPQPGEFDVLARDPESDARAGRLHTAHGVVHTPVFMPVGTQATVKSLTPHDVAGLGFEILLGNTYHLAERPGSDLIDRMGGLHHFMRWDRSILTDSGGFQVWSLAGLNQITDEGVTFKSHLDGSKKFMGPVESMAIQRELGSDIAMLFDECIPWPATREYAENAVERTLRWAKVCRDQPRAPGQIQFAIVQGGEHPELREHCAKELVGMAFDGYAIGGVSVGEPDELIIPGVETSIRHLPETKARYLMGVGLFDQMLESIARGVDMFDCVLPSRSGRTGQAWTRRGPVNLRNARHRDDPRPLDADCTCPACRGYSRAYLHHVVRADEIIGSMLLTWHNLHYYQELMAGLRGAITAGTLDAFVAGFHALRAEGDIEPLTGEGA